MEVKEIVSQANGMLETCFAVVYSGANRYSAYSIVAALESRLSNVATFMVRWDRVPVVIETLAALRRHCRKLIVGITFMTTQVDYVRDLVKLLRQYLGDVLLVAGGPHATGDPLGTLYKLGFDVVVYGEGEETIVKLVQEYDSCGNFRVCGTAYLEGDRVVIKRRGKPVNLDDYPPFPHWRGLFAPIEIMRGCSSACHYCQVTYAFGLPRYRSVEAIRNAASIQLSSGMKDLRFIAPNALGYGSSNGIRPNPSALCELLETLHSIAKKHGGRVFLGSFPSEVRPDSVNIETARLLRLYADNKRVIVGAQSFSDDVLKLLNRGHTVEDVQNAIDVLLEYGFSVDVDVMFGFPFEEDCEIIRALNFMVNKVLSKPGVRLHLHTFMPLPGTPLFEAPIRPLSDTVKKALAKLVGTGKAYGEWREQEVKANIIAGFKEKKLVYGPKENLRHSVIIQC